MNIKLRVFDIKDYDAVYSLWLEAEHIVLRGSDSRESIDVYLARNPELSCVVTIEDEIIGATLMGHDGRCGYIHHLVVKKDYRRMKIGEMMVQTCMEKLGSLGMTRCHIFVLPENTIAIKFWEKMKFIVRSNVSLMTFNSESNV